MSIDGLMAETGWLRRLAVGLVRDEDVADDVVQETVIIAAGQAPRDRPLRPWLHRVLLNRVRMRGRGEARLRARELAAGGGQEPATPEELVARVETQRLLAGLVLELGEPYRAVVLLYFVEGLTSPQIAARLGIAEGTVRWRLKQALDELRARLDERHERRAAWLAPVARLAASPEPRSAAAASAAAGAMLMKKLVLAGALVLVLVALAGVASWKLRGDAAPPVVAARGEAAASSPAAIVAAKRAARGGAPADLTPAAASGRVTRASDGAGVAGAVVALQPRDLGVLGEDLAEGAVVVAVTDAAGAWSARGITPGDYAISASAPGLLPGVRDGVVFAAGAARTGLDLALIAGGVTVSGVVSDVSGGPIAEARIRARGESIAQLRADAAGAVAITGPDGRYRLTLPDGPWRADVEQASYAPTSQSFEIAGAPLTVDFALTPGGAIRGRVVTRDGGAAVPGAIVRAELGGAAAAQGRVAIAIADPAGAFTLRGLRPGAIELSASGRGVASSAPAIVELGIGEEVEGAIVVVERAHTISGFVVRDADPEQGIAGVSVGLFALGAGGGASAIRPSAADGYFEIHGVAPGSYTLFALGRDALPALDQKLEVAGGDVSDVLVRLRTGAVLSGRVEPPVRATVSLELEPASVNLDNMFDALGAALVTGASDPSGAFVLREVPPGKLFLVARAADGHTGRLEVVVGSQDRSGLVIRLAPRGSISGRVVDAAGAPVAGARVEAAGPAVGGRVQIGGGGASVSISGEGALTDAAGAFRLVGLAPGRIALGVSDEEGPLAWADARGAARGAPASFELAEHQQLTGVTLTVEPRDGVIRGLVLGADRRPAPDTWVTARRAGRGGEAGAEPSGRRVVVRVGTSEPEPEGASEPEGETAQIELQTPHTVLAGAGGRFTIPRLRRGSYEVIAEGGRGAASAHRTGVMTGESVTLVLEPLGSLAGAVRAGGAPVTDYSIECRGPARTVGRRVIAADAAYAFDRLPAGAYACRVTAGAGVGAGAATVAGATRLELVLDAWGAITGTVVDARTGAPLPGLRLVTLGADGKPDVEQLFGKGAWTDAAGRFELGRLPPGRGQLLVVSGADLREVARAEFVLTAGQRLELGAIRGAPPTAGPAAN